MFVSTLNKRKNDASSRTLSSFHMTLLWLVILGACSAALVVMIGLNHREARSTSRLTYISNGITYALNLQTGDSVPMGMMQQDPFYAAPLSPDQQWIATWEISTQQQSAVVIVNADTQQPLYRHYVHSDGSRLSWSRDSQWVVLAARDPNDSPDMLDLWMLHHASGQMKRLTHTPEMEIDPIMSPDGTQLAYITIDGSGQHHLYVMDLATQIARPLTSAQNADRPSWSPDSQWIAFEASPDGTNPHIEIIHPDGTDQQAVTPEDVYAYTPLWVP